MNNLKVYGNMRKKLVIAGLVLTGTLTVTGCSKSKPEENHKITVEKSVFRGDTVDKYYEDMDTGYENLKSFKKAFKEENGSLFLNYGDDVEVPILLDDEEYEKYEYDRTPVTISYVIGAGENLWDIANKYGVTVDSIVRDNRDIIDNPNMIQYGTTISIHTTQKYVDEASKENESSKSM